jgi:hypothetical protein
MSLTPMQSTSYPAVSSPLESAPSQATQHSCSVFNEIVLHALSYLVDDAFKAKLRTLPMAKIEELSSFTTLLKLTPSHEDQCHYANCILRFCMAVGSEE